MKTRTLIVALAAISATTLASAEDGANGYGPLPPALVQKPAPATLSERFGTWFVPTPFMQLGALDHGALMSEDEQVEQPAPFRFGIERAVQFSVEDGQWMDVPGGRLWRIGVEAVGSLNARLHISGLNMQAGQELDIISPDQEEKMNGLLELQGEFGNGEAYGLFANGPRTQIEWFVPAGQSTKSLPFESVAYSHGYRDVFGAVSNGGTCSLDPACYATWLNQSNAAAKLTFTSAGASYLCSGQLMATTAADETPYLSTANHCISTTAEANSCQFIFFYRSPTCGAATSAGTTVSGGADLSSTFLASDCTLMLIKGTLPASVYWSGWTNVNPALNAASVGIHHPSGTPQAISFGTKNAASFNCGSPTGNWNSQSWTSGITEGGSSGSAVYLTSDQKMYGVLTCGASACNNTTGKDGYGRWDIAVNTASSNFATLLAAGTDDAQDQNDTCATARALAAGTYSGLIVKRLDEDWYALSVPSAATLTVSMTFTHSNGDIDVQLFTSCGGAIALDRPANTNNESFTFTNSSASNTVYMRVYLASDTRNDYSLTYSSSVTVPSNDNCATASAVGVGSFAFNSSTATTATPTLPSSCDEGSGVAFNNDLWYRFTAPITGRATASTCGAAGFDTRIAVYAGSACPTSASAVLACNDNSALCSGSTSTAKWQVSAGGVYYVRIGSTGATSGAGTLTLSTAPSCQGDFTNDGVVDGGDLGVLLGGWGSPVTSDLNGDGQTDGADLGILLSVWGACP